MIPFTHLRLVLGPFHSIEYLNSCFILSFLQNQNSSHRLTLPSVLSSCLAQLEADKTCPLTTITKRACPTATQTLPNGVFCINPTCGPTPECVILKTITEGCVGTCCPTVTPTVTVTRTCPTCQTGCATEFYTTTTCG